MYYFSEYETGLIGTLTLQSDGVSLCGCWFEEGSLSKNGVEQGWQRDDKLPSFQKAKAWLNRYFHNENPSIDELVLRPQGTLFQHKVWNILVKIPYGTTTTYGEIAAQIPSKSGRKMSAQAVGQAVGHNPLGVIIPCHRVLGSQGQLTGFGGGLEAKKALLTHEGVLF